MSMVNGKKYKVFLVLLAMCVIAKPGDQASAQEAITNADTQTIYRVSDFVGDWKVNGMRLSPNGKKLAFTMPGQDQIFFVIADVVESELRASVRIPFEQDAFPVDVRWATNDRLILTLKQKTKISRTKYYRWSEILMSIKSDGSEPILLRTDGKGFALKHLDNADIINLLRDDPDHILVGKSRRRNWVDEYYDGAIDDVYKLNIKTGELSLYLKGPKIKDFKFHDWYADHKGHIRFGFGYDRKDNSVMIIRGRGTDEWKVLSDNELFEEGKFAPLRFGAADNEFYVLSSLATGRKAVYRFDIASGTLGELVFAHDHVDVTGIVYSYDKGKVVAASYDEDGSKLFYLDDEYGNLRSRLDRALKTGFAISSRSEDDQNMIILAGDERDPGTYYHYNVADGELIYLISRNLNLLPDQMAEMESISYDTRDGLTVNAVLTKPRLHDGQPLPFIVMPHTDPSGMDSIEWDQTVQFLANRGYGVFQPNYRGSSGFGQRFRALGHGEWGRDMQNDLIDGVVWLLDQGHTAEGKICILGRGYAGYAALMGVAKNSDLFSCGIARDAPVDIRKMLSDQEIFSEDDADYLEVAGTLKKKELNSISPINFVKSIESPILLYHREDAYYGVEHMRRFVKKLKKTGKQFDYLEIEEAVGKDIYDANQDHRQFLELVEAWLMDVNPTPQLIQAEKLGKISKMPKTTRSNR